MKFLIIIFISLLMFANTQVSAKEKSGKSTSKTKAKLQCSKKRRTGSHLRTRGACRTLAQKKQDKEDARNVIESQRSFSARSVVPVDG